MSDFLGTSGFSFSNLNLSGVKAAAATQVLSPGQYVCKVTAVKIADTKEGGGKMLQVSLREVNDKGVITDRINVHNKNAKAVEIGLEQLKALAVFGGHPTPDAPGDPQSFKGLTVGVVVGSEVYQGEKRSKVNGYMDPTTVKGYTASEATASDAPAIGTPDRPF